MILFALAWLALSTALGIQYRIIRYLWSKGINTDSAWDGWQLRLMVSILYQKWKKNVIHEQ